MGFIANPYPYLVNAKCLVLSSLHEGFPVILAEALACGCPVIATRCETGPEEIIDHEKNGLLIPVNDTYALAEAMNKLLNDPVLYGAIKQNTRSSVQHLDIEEVAKRWLEL
jgi:N-acetylgalactosamine-N,N'-diacetylbacillosaminyl-diphospho-undecaprenol 4-alpha-N-acetylgalactosaminyltransferase